MHPKLPIWLIESLGLVAVLAVMIVAFSLDGKTFVSIANQRPALTVIAVGMTFVLIVAGIDLSVGSVMALSGVVLGYALVEQGLPIGVAVPMCVVTGLLCGLLNGLVTVRWAIPSFIVTLGMLQIARGAALHLSDQEAVGNGLAAESVNMMIAIPLTSLKLSPAFLMAVTVVLVGNPPVARQGGCIRHFRPAGRLGRLV